MEPYDGIDNGMAFKHIACHRFRYFDWWPLRLSSEYCNGTYSYLYEAMMKWNDAFSSN